MKQETMVNYGATAPFIPCRNTSFSISSDLARASSFQNEPNFCHFRVLVISACHCMPSKTQNSAQRES